MVNAVMQSILIFASILAPIITAIVQGVKRSFDVPKNWLPAISLVVGLLTGVLAAPFSDLELFVRLWSGGLAGLAAVGLFELGNNRAGTTKE